MYATLAFSRFVDAFIKNRADEVKNSNEKEQRLLEAEETQSAFQMYLQQ